jgi:DNA-binding MarR family transcriptional regulator
MMAIGPLTPGELSRRVYLSQATVTGILDRLEQRGLVKRERNRPDRRMVSISLTEQGEKLALTMPWPLQERFARRLAALSRTEQEHIDQCLKQIVDMMEARKIEAWPIMGAGTWTNDANIRKKPAAPQDP